MTDFQLFQKYNTIFTSNQKKDDKLIDELYYQKLKNHRGYSEKILLLMHGNYSCNLNCIYCEHNKLRSNYQTVIMPEDIALQAIQKLGPILREITWHGGEPTLLPQSLIKAVEEEKNKINNEIKTTLQTNSVKMVDPEMRQFLNDLNIHWGTSFDGLDNTKNRGQKSTDSILYLIKELGDDFPGFITVYTNESVTKMIDNYNYYKSIGVKHFQSCIVRENVVENTNPYLVNTDISVECVLNYFNYWIHDCDNPIEDSYLQRQLTRVLGDTKVCEDAYCIKRWFILDPYGNIGQCGQSADEANLVNIKDIKHYSDLLYHPKLLTIVNKQENLIKNHCSDCPWLRVCFGGCMGNNYEYDKTYSSVNPRTCEYNKNLLYGIYDIIKDIDIEKDEAKYNPYFIKILKGNNYFSLTEIKKIEEEKYAEHCSH